MSKKNKAKNLGQIAKGKVQEAAGKLSSDDDLLAEGRANQVEGNIKQAGEKVKDAFTA